MKDRINRLLKNIPAFLKNKYLITLFVFFIWILLFDNSNLIDRYQDVKSLRQLEQDKEYYTKRIEEDKRKLNELKTDNENLEKFAREQYFMKMDDEDLFKIVSDEKNK